MNGDVPIPLEEMPLEIRKHLSVCDCSCDHMGFGNYQSLRRQQQKTPPPPLEFTDLEPGPVGPCDLVSDHVFPADHNFHVLPPDCERAYGTLNHVIRHAGSSDAVSDVSGEQYADQLSEDAATAEHIRLEEQKKQRTRGRRLACGYACWLCCAVLVVALAAGVGVSVPMVLQIEPRAGLEQRLHAAKQILQQVPLIDGHNDLPWNIRKFVHNNLRIFNFTADLRRVRPWASSQWSHTDIPRLREGHVGAQFWAAYVPCESQYKNAVQMTLEQVDLIKRVVRQYSDYLSLALTADDIMKGHKEGKIVSLIGLEGGHSIQSTLATLRAMYELGVRYMTLTHTCDTPWAECAPIPGYRKPPGPNGLTRFGLTVVREMNRLGMMIDLSHVSEPAMKRALEHSQAPVIFSHSSAQALCNSSRNVPDYLLKKLARNGGLVMVSFYNYFLTCNGSARIADVVAHINHIRRVAGVDHVGIGAGYDGINSIPAGLEDVSRYPYLFAELLKDASWSVPDLQKLAGLNLIRAFRKVEEVRDTMKRQGIEPLEELIPRRDLEGTLNCTYSLYRMRQRQRGQSADDDVRDNHS